MVIFVQPIFVLAIFSISGISQLLLTQFWPNFLDLIFVVSIFKPNIFWPKYFWNNKFFDPISLWPTIFFWLNSFFGQQILPSSVPVSSRQLSGLDRKVWFGRFDLVRFVWRIKSNLPNQTFLSKPDKANVPNQTFLTKPTKPNLFNQTY